MKLKLLIILSAWLLLVSSCQKRKYPQEITKLDDQEIYVDAYVDGEPVALKIGTDGYYCYTSYKQRVDSIYVFEGDLKKFNCNSCGNSLKVELSDYCKRLPGSSVDVDVALGKGARSFIPGVEKPGTIRFTAYSNKQISSVRWDLSNGFSSQDPAMTYEFGQPGPQTVTLTVRTNDNCESKVVNKIFVGTDGLFACGITTLSAQNTFAAFKPNVVGGKAPFRYTWYFGDGDISHDESPSHNYKWTGSYPVKVRIEDAENHVCESNYVYVTGNDKSSCASNMSLSYISSRNAFLDGVKLQWTDKSNSVLKSQNVDQPAGSYFEIINSQEYAANEKGEAGRLLTLRFNVLLSDGNRKVWFKSENATIAVAYK